MPAPSKLSPLQELGELRRKGEEAEARVTSLQEQLEAIEDAQVGAALLHWPLLGCHAPLGAAWEQLEALEDAQVGTHSEVTECFMS